MPQDCQRGPKGRPKGAQGHSKGNHRSPKDAKRDPKGSQKSQKETKRFQRDISLYSPNKDFSQGRGSYFSFIVIPLAVRTPGRQVPKPRCLSPAADSLDFRIAGLQGA